jgi:tRNA (mo5U34)-methyltransferase
MSELRRLGRSLMGSPGAARGRSGTATADAAVAGIGEQVAALYRRGFEPFLNALAATPLASWVEPLADLTAQRLQPRRHGDLEAWIAALARLPALAAQRVRLDQACVGVDSDQPLPAAAREHLRAALEALHPWRKGPFCLHGVEIDAEWRSDWKWARIAGAITPLAGRRVLDVGCGNGYYAYRALGAGADLVLGIDPTLRFVFQFLALNQLIGAERLAVFPLGDDDLPQQCGGDGGGFDTLFSMGVLYHRRDPDAHLRRLRGCLRPGGELVLETLVIDASGRQALVPKGRYAQMRNVHAIPSLALLSDWLSAAGYERIRLADLSRTSIREQRSTPWMRFQSLADFLDPADPSLTVEGHPAPVRALMLAQRPSASPAASPMVRHP